ncbi:BnaAnng23170D [Brassica napus]|uniref:(rape) hypothetical protein n=1 Tax=Brassica napus TaxID=3708 RepID=A0A078JMB2_BRANA|nr:unnamed protein product [Brassica napus]CDY66891.1 BnaAnng23170D [Brassica napus]
MCFLQPLNTIVAYRTAEHRICFYYLFHLIFCSLSTDYYKYSRLWSKTDGSSMFQWRNICRGGVGDCIYWCRDHGYYYGGCFAEACCCQI